MKLRNDRVNFIDSSIVQLNIILKSQFINILLCIVKLKICMS